MVRTAPRNDTTDTADTFTEHSQGDIQQRARSGRTRKRGRAARRVAYSGAILVAMLIIVLIGSLFAPGAPAPASFFTSPTPAPLAHQRGHSAPTTPLATTLREQAQMQYIDSIIAHMSLDDELGQMVMIGFAQTQMDSSLAYQIQQLHVGSAIIYAFNIKSGPQVKQLISDMQADSTIPLLIATDQEGGAVNRMATIEGLTPSASMVGATKNPDYARQRGEQDAQALTQVGVNLDLAPVVDVLQTSGGDIQSRSFGSSPTLVTQMAGAYLTGLQQSGQVVGTLKHFPGLGAVPVDPHATLYKLTRSRAELESIDWAPYRALLATGQVHAIMSTHVVLTAIDPTRPASLSKPVLTGILRDEMGYNGVIITDGIYMNSLNGYTLDQIAVYAVEAGNDIICSTYSIQSTEEVIAALKSAVLTGQMPKSRIDDSVRRILLLKLRLGLLAAPQFDVTGGN